MDPLKRSCEILLKKNLKVSVAESLTGGMITAELVSFPGISAVLEQAYVTYSDEAKHTLLGVRTETLMQKGAVSRETARQMALYVKKVSGADIGLSSTGIAGPTGATTEKPVGLVFLSCAIAGRVVTRKYIFKGGRDLVRFKSMKASIRLLYDCLKRYGTDL